MRLDWLAKLAKIRNSVLFFMNACGEAAHKIRNKITTNKVDVFWEGNKNLKKLPSYFCHYVLTTYLEGDFFKLCGLLRIYELYLVRKTVNCGLSPSLFGEFWHGTIESWHSSASGRTSGHTHGHLPEHPAARAPRDTDIHCKARVWIFNSGGLLYLKNINIW